MTRLLASALAIALALASGAPANADAQLLDRIKRDAARRAAAAKEKRDSAIVTTTGKAVDSALTKRDRPLVAGVEKAGSGVDTALNVTERGAVSRFGPQGPSAADIIAMFEQGRAVLTEIRFVPNSDQLALTAERPLRALAAAMSSLDSATFLIELYTDASDTSAGAAADTELSKRREAALKARLVEAQAPAGRFFVRWSGAGTPARVEVMKAQ